MWIIVILTTAEIYYCCANLLHGDCQAAENLWVLLVAYDKLVLYAKFTQMQDDFKLRWPPGKNVCQGKMYLSQSKMIPQNKMSAKKKCFNINFLHLIHKVCQILASHKSDPSSVPQGYGIHTLGHVGGGNRCGGDTLLRVTMTHAVWRGSGLPKTKWKVSCWRLHGTGVVIAVL